MKNLSFQAIADQAAYRNWACKQMEMETPVTEPTDEEVARNLEDQKFPYRVYNAETGKFVSSSKPDRSWGEPTPCLPRR